MKTMHTERGRLTPALLALLCACAACSGGGTSTDDTTGDMDSAGSKKPANSTNAGSSDEDSTPSKTSTGSAGAGSSKPATNDTAGADAPDQAGSAAPQEDTTPPPADGPPGCGADSAAFCDTFDTASPGGRGGDLDDAEWSVGRISGFSNAGQNQLEWFGAGKSEACGALKEGIVPGNDYYMCDGGGRMVNTYSDGGGFTIMSMRVRRPFDFKDRTGVISFDVDARSMVYLGHGFWWNFMLTEDPEPTPYQEGGALQLFSRNGIGVEFQGAYNCDDYTASQNSISQVFGETDYAINTRIMPETKCFDTKEGVMNHVEIRVSENSFDVFVADAGKPETLRNILSLDEQSAPNMFPLTFSRGYIHLQHSHYNAAKTGMIPAYATYQWDNVTFDGPMHPTPRSYSVPDSLTDKDEGRNVAYELTSSGFKHTLPGVDLSGAKSAVLTFNTDTFAGTDTIGWRFNDGSWHDVPFYFPGSQGGGARPIVLDVPLDELVAGDNTVELRGTDSWPGIVAAQIELTVETE